MAQTFVPAEDDYYGILQISQHACKQVIKAAYKALALMRHPDQNVDSPDAIKEFQLLNRAHEVLIDDTQRRQYDRDTYPGVLSRQEQARKQKPQQPKPTEAPKPEQRPPKQEPPPGQEPPPKQAPKPEPENETPKSTKSARNGKSPFVYDKERYKVAIETLDSMKEDLDTAIAATELALESLSLLSTKLDISKSSGPTDLTFHVLVIGEAQRRKVMSLLNEESRDFHVFQLEERLAEEDAKREKYAAYLHEQEEFLQKHEFFEKVDGIFKNHKWISPIRK